MTTRRSTRRKKVLAGVGAVALGGLIGTWFATNPDRAPKAICGGLRGAVNGVCDQIAPVELNCCTAAIPPQPLEGQVIPSKSGCPAASRQINGGCWISVEATPPCPEGYTYQHDGKCYAPLILLSPPARVPKAGKR